MDRQTHLQKMTEVVNARYAMLDDAYYEVPEKQHDLLQDLELACEEFELTEIEAEIMDYYWMYLVTPILKKVVNDDSVIFNHFLSHRHHTIILCFIGIYEVDTLELCINVDNDIDDEIQKAIDKINYYQMQPTI